MRRATCARLYRERRRERTAEQLATGGGLGSDHRHLLYARGKVSEELLPERWRGGGAFGNDLPGTARGYAQGAAPLSCRARESPAAAAAMARGCDRMPRIWLAPPLL